MRKPADLRTGVSRRGTAQTPGHPGKADALGRVMRVVVGFYPYREKLAMGNLMWPGKFPARRGWYPREHPAAPATKICSDEAGQMAVSPALVAFRGRGYWASCFPEGDGITWKPLQGQSDEQALADVRECFPEWRVVERDEFQPLLQEWERDEATKERARRRAFIEGKERARTGLCSHIIKFGVFCSLDPGHDGKHAYVPPPPPPAPAPRRCCPTCGEWIDGAGHQCGRRASA